MKEVRSQDLGDIFSMIDSIIVNKEQRPEV
jgi:hypothetical protein